MIKTVKILMFSIVSFYSFSQEYHQMAEIIRQKTDANKIAGINRDREVLTTFDVDLSHLQGSEIQVFKHKITGSSRMRYFSLRAGGMKFALVSKGKYAIKDLKTYIATTSTVI